MSYAQGTTVKGFLLSSVLFPTASFAQGSMGPGGFIRPLRLPV